MKKRYFPYTTGTKTLGTVIRCIVVLFFVCIAQMKNEIYAQEKKYSFKVQNVSLKEGIKQLEDISDFHFFFKSEEDEMKKNVNLEFEESDIYQILDKLITGTNLSYQVEDKYIAMINKEDVDSQNDETQDNPINSSFNITGKVSDDNGLPLPGVSIVEQGTSTGTISRSDGGYTITVSSENATLLFSFIGMQTKTIPISGRTTLDAVMQTENSELDEIVVVGYGSQSRRKVTGAISQLKSAQLENIPVTSFDQALAGQVAGVQVTQATGAPGAGADIKIRGIGTITAGTSPLIVIDGFPSETFKMSDINPQDIESVQVLKDAASAAIYGSRGSNGVILVATKKGSHTGTQINFNAYTGFQSVINTYDMADAYQWAEFQTEALRTADPEKYPSTFTPDVYADYLAGKPGLTNTDWQNEFFRTAPISKYQLSVAGGNEKTRYYISGELFEQEGILISTDFKRYNFRSNLVSTIYEKPEASFFKNIELGVNLSPTYSTSNKVSQSHHNHDGIIITGLFAYPNFTAYNPDGSFTIGEQIKFGQSPTGLNTNGARFENPVAVAHRREQVEKRFNLLASTYLDFQLVDNLSFKTYLGINYVDINENIFRPSDIGTRRNIAPVTATGGLDINNLTNSISEYTLNYKKSMNDIHNIDVLAGYSFQQEQLFESDLTSENKYAVSTSSFYNAEISTGGDQKNEEWALISYISRINYDYDGKYLVSASFRRDGSSRFGVDSKWGNFPSISLGWIASEEQFLYDNDAISNLKIRGSWGITGNNSIPNYGSVPLLSEAYYGDLKGIDPSTSPNSNLSWEETTQLNFGLDLGLFDNKFLVIADYYNSTTDGLLLNVPVPAQSGYTDQLRNIGSVENKGFELNVAANKIDLGGVKWSASANISANENDVLSLGGQERIVSKFHKTEVGKPLGEFYLWNFTGVYNTQAEIDATAHIKGTTPGDYIIEDVNEDGEIDDNDRKVFGNSQPDFTYGFSTSFEYKGFDLNILLQGAVGVDVVNFNYFFVSLEGGFSNVLSERVTGRWQSPANPGTGYAKAGSKTTYYDRSNKILQSADFLRFRNITLGYTVPKTSTKKIGLEKLRIYISSINPFTFTKYSGFNPEVNSDTNGNGGPLQPGLDWGNYPTAKSITAGVNITF